MAKEDFSLERVNELRQRVFDSPGWKIRAQVATLNRTYEAFVGNHAELTSHLNAHKEPRAIIELWDIRHRDRLDSYLGEVDRLLQNFLASASSLRDHQRRLRGKAGEAGREEYDDRVQRIFGVAGRFVFDLRNFTLHRRLPVTRGQVRGIPGEILESYVVLARSALLKWDGWSATGRDLLASVEDDVRLDLLVEDYFRRATAFHKWFEWVVLSANREALEESNRLIDEYNAYLPPHLREAS
jgi:hypothetical protein